MADAGAVDHTDQTFGLPGKEEGGREEGEGSSETHA